MSQHALLDTLAPLRTRLGGGFASGYLLWNLLLAWIPWRAGADGVPAPASALD